MAAVLEQALEQLQNLLGNPEKISEEILKFALEDTAEHIRNYCHIDDIPDGLMHTWVRMALDLVRNECFGSASLPNGVKSISMGDTSTSFCNISDNSYAGSLLKTYEKTLRRYRKLDFHCGCRKSGD